MSEQFICISCWKEFSAHQDEISKRGGKVVCPYCGYVQPAPSDVNGGESMEVANTPKLESQGRNDPDVAEEISWASVGAADDDEDFPISEDDEHTDRVEIPKEFVSNSLDQELGMDAQAADEKTPVEADALQRNLQELLEENGSADNAVLVEKKPDRPATVNWQLKTPSGLTFKFTDPEALLGWKKKLATYKQLHVSVDGEQWVDFARFVREYEETGDALNAFEISANLSDEDLPPPKPVPREDDLPESEEVEDAEDEEARRRVSSTAPQFTFKVKEEKSTGWGKYLLLALLGLGVGTGIVLAVLHFTGIWSPLP